MSNRIDLIAIDPSLNSTGVFARWGSHEMSQTIRRVTGSNRYKQLCEIFALIDVWCSSKKPELAIIEAYAFSGFGNAKTKLAEVGGVVRLACARNRIPILEVTSQTWKAATLGSAKVPKKSIPDMVHDRYGREFDSQDACEAWLMAYAVDRALRETGRLKSRLCLKVLEVLDERDRQPT